MTYRILQTNTGRTRRLACWTITTEGVREAFKSGHCRTAKDLGWMLLSDKESTARLERDCTKGDDIPGGNFALRTFEQALDWTLGLAVTRFIDSLARVKKVARTFSVGVDRRGEAYIILSSGRTLAAADYSEAGRIA